DIVDKFKYLGIVFDPNLSWCEHVNYLSSNISKRIGVICRVKNYICHPLAYICNLSIFTSVFLSKWKMAKVTPIYKDGDKSDVSNYRPISVLPIISKILER
ncbi:unnamed protein product, partial [marine sediment metagenome]